MLQTVVETAADVVVNVPAPQYKTYAQERQYTAQGRAAIVTHWLDHGDGLTIKDVMRLTGLSRRGACRLMHTLSYHLPIYREAGVWQMCAMRELKLEN